MRPTEPRTSVPAPEPPTAGFAATARRMARHAVYRCLPLALRKRFAIWLNHQRWMSPERRGWLAARMVADLAQKDVNAYHKFLWQNHLSYARTYETELRFGRDNINGTRLLFFEDMVAQLRRLNLRPETDVHSVFEVGCSLGYLLRHLETEVFPAARILEGSDIDAYAVAKGSAYLEHLGSQVALMHGDMESLSEALAGRHYDVMFAAGVLLYLTEDAAQRLVADMLDHTRHLLAIAALAHPERDNRELTRSVPREHDGTWIHNVDRMLENAGARILDRRWEGARKVDGNTIYFLFAQPPAR